jgi:hypothetical protein
VIGAATGESQEVQGVIEVIVLCVYLSWSLKLSLILRLGGSGPRYKVPIEQDEVQGVL